MLIVAIFFFNDTATTEIYTLSLHDALPIWPKPDVDPEGAFQMRISQLDYNNFVGVIGIGRIQRGTLKKGMPVAVIDREGKKRQGKIGQVLGFLGLERIEQDSAEAGDIVAISGIPELTISDTVTSLEVPEALPALSV